MVSSPVSHRRALHQIPELSFELPKTVAYVRTVLESLSCTLSAPIPGSVCAFFDAGKEESVAFRADMDALPVTEQTGASYCSTHPSQMHACGHDGHTAMALALAEYVSAHLSDLPRNVLLIFQPAEETSGGAKPLCDTGLLSQYRVKRLFGLHLWPKLTAGTVFSRSGPLLAQANEVTVTITGKSVHLSRHQEGTDALIAGARFLQDAYAALDAIELQTPRTLRFGKMVSGTVRNAISGQSVLEGSLRTYDEESFLRCRDVLNSIAQEVSAHTGCLVDVHLNDGFPAVWNPEAFYEEICTALGNDAPAPLESPSLAGEDFSFYQKHVPALFFFLGLGNVPELHAPNFNFDDETILPVGVDFLKKLLLLP